MFGAVRCGAVVPPTKSTIKFVSKPHSMQPPPQPLKPHSGSLPPPPPPPPPGGLKW